MKLKDLGFRIEGSAAHRFEGGDMVILPGGESALMGYGVRSEREAANELSDFLDIPVAPIELINPDLFHLDLVLAVLSDGTLFVCKDAMSAESWKMLSRHQSFKNMVIVSLEEAFDFALNWIEINDTVIMGRRVPRIIEQLERLGRKVKITRLEQFHRFNGGAACLVNKVHQFDK